MFIAALILLLVAALLVVAAVFGGSATTTVDVGFGQMQLSAMTVFFLGMATLLVLVLSLGLFRIGARRARARRADRRKVSELSTKLDAYQRGERAPTVEGDVG